MLASVTPGDIVRELGTTPDAIRSLATIPPPQATWRPAPDSWSILEVVCHLADEERLDFRTRLRTTIASPTAPWPAIDPGSWVAGYAGRQLDEALADFEAERRSSLAWLGSLRGVDWQLRHEDAARSRSMSALDLLRNWLAHDYHHLRQLTVIRYELLRQSGGALAYAGDW